MKTNRRIRVIITPLLILVVGLLLFCGAGGVAIKQGVIKPPTLHLTINGIGLVAKITNVPSCAVWFIACGRVKHLANNEMVYALWIVWEPASSPRESPGARRLFAMRLVR